MGFNFDIKNAYDSVYTDVLVLKYLQLGMIGNIAKLICLISFNTEPFKLVGDDRFLRVKH